MEENGLKTIQILVAQAQNSKGHFLGQYVHFRIGLLSVCVFIIVAFKSATACAYKYIAKYVGD
jgi:hypothetical protein